LDLAIATADRQNLTLVLASDPDADRFAAAERLPSGEWRALTGNQLGILFAAHTLESCRNEGKDIKMLAMLASTVSTQMLQAMANAEGFYYEETLTGFKWLGNQALILEDRGYDAAYAFEEAIGYMFSPVVHDKDGIAAASVFITMARQWAKEGLSVHQRLDQLFRKYGYFETANSYLVSPDSTLTRKVFAEIRGLGSPYPKRLGSRNITRWRDLTEGFDSATKGGVPVLPVSQSSEMITCELEGGVRFTVRGSGTEPKIKSKTVFSASNTPSVTRTQKLMQRCSVYVECKAETQEQARRGAQEVSADLTREWFRPAETGLLLP
jgi:phosphoglucomutase